MFLKLGRSKQDVLFLFVKFSLIDGEATLKRYFKEKGKVRIYPGNDKLQMFEDQPIRTAGDEENEEWYFSIVDVVKVLTDSSNPQTYWRV